MPYDGTRSQWVSGETIQLFNQVSDLSYNQYLEFTVGYDRTGLRLQDYISNDMSQRIL